MMRVKEPTKLARVAAVVCLAMLVAVSPGCLNSENPVDVPAGTEVDAAPYAGDWELTFLDGQPPTGNTMTLSILDGAVGATATLTEGTDTDGPMTVQLTDIGGDVIISVQDSGGSGWDIFRVSLQGGGNTLSLARMDPVVVASEIQGASIGGTVTEFEEGDDVIELAATPAELRTWIPTVSNLFIDDAIVFARVP